MEGLPKDIHYLLFEKYLNVRDGARLSGTCKYFRIIHEDMWKKEDEKAMREIQRDINKRNLKRIKREKRNTKDASGNIYPFDRWAVCRKCNKVYAAKDIEKHQCRPVVPEICRWCNLYVYHMTCPFEEVVCSIIHEGCDKRCTYRGPYHRVKKHRESLGPNEVMVVDGDFGITLKMYATTYNMLRIMSGAGRLQYNN